MSTVSLVKMEIPAGLRSVTKKTIAAAGALGPIGPFSSAGDIAAIAGCWCTLLVSYAGYYNVSLNKDNAKEICSSVLLGIGGYYAGCKVASKLFQAIPGAGTVLGIGISSITNVIFTYRFAITLNRVFSEGVNNLEGFVDTLKYVFARSWDGLISAKEIYQLYRYY